jgi:hypothetical protein
VQGGTAIAVCLDESAALYHNDHRTWMYVPSGLGARLKYQQGLERIARPVHVQVYMFLSALALRLRDNL